MRGARLHSRLQQFLVLFTAGCLVALGMLVAPATAGAATSLTVSTTADVAADSGACGNSSIVTAPTPLSLREATCLANNLGGAVTISVPAGSYNLSNGELRPGMHSGQSVTIAGAGASTTIVSGQGLSRVFDIDPNSVGGVNSALSGMTVTGGSDSTFGGAGILAGAGNASTADVMSLDGMTITGNSADVGTPGATNQPGGGLEFQGGKLTVSNSTFSNNTAHSSQGSGLFYQATGTSSPEGLTVTGSTFSTNHATNTNGSPVNNGGALALQGSTSFTVAGSRFIDNTSIATTGSPVGGAIWAQGGTLSVNSSTFTGNSVSGSGTPAGGAIYTASTALAAHFDRFTGNSASTGGAIYQASGSVDAADDWWGCNTGPGTAGCDTVAGGPIVSPRLVLSVSASPATVIGPDATSTVTASLTSDSLGATIGGANLAAFEGLPVSFSDPPGDATVTDTSKQFSAGQAGDGYQSHTTFGPDPVSATLDNATVSTTITVDELPAITSAGSVHFDPATAGSFTVTSVGYPTPALSETGTLPAGLSFTDNGDGTATLAGTPTGAGGTYPVTITANNGVNPNATQTLTITVGQPSTPPTVTGSPTAATAGQPYSFAFGTSGTPAPAVTVSAGSLPPGLSLSGAGLLSGTPTTAGSFDFTVRASNGTPPDALDPVTMVVNATVPDPPIAVQAVAGDRSATVSWTAPAFTGGAPVTSYTVLGTDLSTSATFSQQVTGSPVPTTASVTGLTGGDSYQFQIIATNIAGNSTASAPSATVIGLSPPVIDGTPPAGTVGLGYSYPFSTSGYPAPTVTVTAGSLPPGLALSSAGLLSGTPTTAGTFAFTVTAGNGVDPAASRQVSLAVTPAAAATVTATSGLNQTGTAGQPFAQLLVATVLDSVGNPVNGASVTFTVTAGSATFAGGTKTATVVSNAAGQASAPVLTAGKTAGPVTVMASSGSAGPATFAETVLPISAARADLAVTVSAPASIPRSSTFTVTVKVTNNGPNSASTLLATLGLGNGLTVVSAPGGTIFGSTVIYAEAGLASNATLTYTVQVRAGHKAASTSLLAGALAINPDPVLSNNLAVAKLRIS